MAISPRTTIPESEDGTQIHRFMGKSPVKRIEKRDRANQIGFARPMVRAQGNAQAGPTASEPFGAGLYQNGAAARRPNSAQKSRYRRIAIRVAPTRRRMANAVHCAGLLYYDERRTIACSATTIVGNEVCRQSARWNRVKTQGRLRRRYPD